MLLSQNYPEYEIIIINDQSEDETKYVLEEYEAVYAPKLKVVTITDHIYEFSGKKFALTLGIKAAQNPIILLTDADCKPVGENWIGAMASPYKNKQTDIVLGFSPYEKKGSLLNLFIQFDTFYTALQYLSFALGNNPYMGVGRNLSYRKELFFKSKGFAPFLKINSGDDDLFVNHNATATNTAVQLNPESFTLSQPKKSWMAWFHQKKRHMRTGKLYKAKHKYALAYIFFSNWFFYLAVIATCILVKPFWIGLAVLGLRMKLQTAISFGAAKRLQMPGLWPFVPFIDIIYQLIYMPIFGLAGMFSRKKNGW
ncbi:MAG: glycosyltransferase [Sphingobacteriales bacterium]|nr:MAG: glycosyltransferase [Sphingobacteriales bacterium]